ncbi:hypothetical protein ABTL46_21990, partial [Acinetobacter baumannii]
PWERAVGCLPARGGGRGTGEWQSLPPLPGTPCLRGRILQPASCPRGLPTRSGYDLDGQNPLSGR